MNTYINRFLLAIKAAGGVNRLIVLITSWIVVLGAGSLYGYSSFSPTLKNQLDWKQTETTLVGTIGTIGIYTAAPMGFINDKFGARVTSVLATIFAGGGYFLSYMGAVGWIPEISEMFMIYFYAIGVGSYGVAVLTLGTNIKNYPPSQRGIILGLLAAPFGLSSAMYTLIYNTFFF